MRSRDYKQELIKEIKKLNGKNRNILNFRKNIFGLNNTVDMSEIDVYLDNYNWKDEEKFIFSKITSENKQIAANILLDVLARYLLDKNYITIETFNTFINTYKNKIYLLQAKDVLENEYYKIVSDNMTNFESVSYMSFEYFDYYRLQLLELYGYFEVTPTVAVRNIGILLDPVKVLYIKGEEEDLMTDIFSFSHIIFFENCKKDLKGRLIIVNVGSGFFTYMSSLIDDVEEILVLEQSVNKLKFFKTNILPLMKNKDKVKTLKVNPVEYLKKISDGEYNYILSEAFSFYKFDVELLMNSHIFYNKFRQTKVLSTGYDSFIYGMRRVMVNELFERILSSSGQKWINQKMSGTHSEIVSAEVRKYIDKFNVVSVDEIYKMIDINNFQNYLDNL